MRCAGGEGVEPVASGGVMLREDSPTRNAAATLAAELLFPWVFNVGIDAVLRSPSLKLKKKKTTTIL